MHSHAQTNKNVFCSRLKCSKVMFPGRILSRSSRRRKKTLNNSTHSLFITLLTRCRLHNAAMHVVVESERRPVNHLQAGVQWPNPGERFVIG